MRFASPFRATVGLSLWLLIAFFPTARTAAEDAETRHALARLADRNPNVRSEAIDALGHGNDPRAAKLLQAYNESSLYLWKGQVVFCENVQAAPGGKRLAPLSDPLTRKPLTDSAGKPLVVDAKEIRELSPTPAERRLVVNLLRFLQDFASSDPDKRLSAARRFGDSRDPKLLPALEKVAHTDSDIRVRRAARDSFFLLKITADVPGETAEDRLEAVRALGRVHSVQGRDVLKRLLNNNDVDLEERPVYERAVRQIDRYQYWVGWGRDLTNGLSLGSVLILMALGLSIIYGQMGVINMAHGELMMIGAYATFETQRFFGHNPDHLHNWYYLIAFPVSFFAAAVVGWLIERLVVRHLYGRPLETLLATWGVSLILIQAARVRYGDNIGVNSPTWLIGGFEILPDFGIEYARCFILGLCMVCVFFVYFLMNFTPIGLKIRATVQDRETAETLGVATRRVDGFTFALGAGLAGVAGYALTSIAGVTPDMGQNYIVDSFLVVVVGGVGKLAGSVWAGLGMGVLDKLVEPVTFGAALLSIGSLVMVLSWILLAIKSFRENRKLGWLTLLVPIPLPFAVKYWSRPQVPKLFSLYVFGAAALTIGLLRNVMWKEFLGQDVQTRWARVLILLVVVVFIQWRPAGLFPPKGRLADV